MDYAIACDRSVRPEDAGARSSIASYLMPLDSEGLIHGSIDGRDGRGDPRANGTGVERTQSA